MALEPPRCACCCGGAVADAELGVDVVEVLLDGAGCDPERLGDLVVSHAACDELQHLGLSFCQ
jgi:hypothetical protein